MTERLHSIVRKTGPIVSAGVLLQAGGCVVDANSAVQEILTTVVNNLIATFVFGAFNLPVL